MRARTHKERVTVPLQRGLMPLLLRLSLLSVSLLTLRLISFQTFPAQTKVNAVTSSLWFTWCNECVNFEIRLSGAALSELLTARFNQLQSTIQ